MESRQIRLIINVNGAFTCSLGSFADGKAAFIGRAKQQPTFNATSRLTTLRRITIYTIAILTNLRGLKLQSRVAHWQSHFRDISVESRKEQAAVAQDRLCRICM